MNSFISWIGGKRVLRNNIHKCFPEQEEYDRYVEVFGGAGWILFAKDKHAALEVFNDANGDLINLYRCVKYHCQELQRELQWICSSRELFFDYMEQIHIRGLTDIQRAARFFVMIKCSFGSDLRTFGAKPRKWNKVVGYLSEVQKRLEHVVIENNDFQKILKTYDRTNTLFYLDPPYYKTEKYYQVEFTKEDHQRLRDSLGKIKGKFVLSYNDCAEIRELYAGYNILGIGRFNNMSSEKGNVFNELIIRNF